MRLILIGCEYTGKTTLARGITEWLIHMTGSAGIGWHDHFEFPHVVDPTAETDEEVAQILTLRPSLLEKFQRYMIQYHFNKAFFLDDHHLLTNWYYGDAVYAPIYCGYGGPGQYADRHVEARRWDSEVMELAPDTVLVLLKAGPDTIRQRMREQPHPRSVLKEADIVLVLARFEAEFNGSFIRRRFTLDTTNTTAAETLDEFVQQMTAHLSEADQLRILSHQAMKQNRPVQI